MADGLHVDPRELSAWGGQFSHIGRLATSMVTGLSEAQSALLACLGLDEPSLTVRDLADPQFFNLGYVIDGFRDASGVAGDGIGTAADSYAATERHVYETVQIHKPAPPPENPA